MRYVQPCGTPAAYLRHLRKGEKACDACREAQNAKSRMTVRRKGEDKGRRPAIPSKHTTVHTTVMDKALEKDPPVIEWRRKPNGVLVHVKIHDPHADTTSPVRNARQRAYYEQKKGSDV